MSSQLIGHAEPFLSGIIQHLRKTFDMEGGGKNNLQGKKAMWKNYAERR